MESTAERVKRLHEEALIIDGHNDMPSHVVQKRSRGMSRVIETHYLEDIRAGGVDIVVAAVFIEDYHPETALKMGLKQVMAMKEEVEESASLLKLCLTYADILEAAKEKKTGIILALEGAEPLQQDLFLLRVFYDLGVRVMGLSWSRRNFAADGCGFEKEEKDIKSGLTAFGKDLVKYCEGLGMIPDVSHLSEASFWDVVQNTEEPFIASHTNCRHILNIKRNFADAQIRALGERGGVVCINGVNGLTVPPGREDSPEVMADHMDHIKNIAGIDALGLGLDLYAFFMGGDLTVVRDGHERIVRDVIKDYSHLPFLTEVLIERGYTDDEIKKFLGGNLLRVFKQRLK